MTEPAYWTLKSEFLTIAPPTSPDSHYYPHFTVEDKEAQRSDLSYKYPKETNKQKREESKFFKPGLLHCHEHHSWRIQVICTEQPGPCFPQPVASGTPEETQKLSETQPSCAPSNVHQMKPAGWSSWFPKVSSPRATNPKPVERSPDVEFKHSAPNAVLCTGKSESDQTHAF